MLKVILDTNFLVYCAENKVDYKNELEDLLSEGHKIIVLEQTISELNEIRKNAKKLSDRDAADLALKLIEHNQVEIIIGHGNYADEAILNFVKNSRDPVIIATLDFALRKKLKNSRKIVILGKKKLAFE